MSKNQFGYVEIKDGKVIAYTGNPNKPDVHIFENDEIVEAVNLQVIVKEEIATLEDDRMHQSYMKNILKNLVRKAQNTESNRSES